MLDEKKRGTRRKEGRGGRRDEEGGTRRKEGRGGRRDKKSEKMKKSLEDALLTARSCFIILYL